VKSVAFPDRPTHPSRFVDNHRSLAAFPLELVIQCREVPGELIGGTFKNIVCVLCHIIFVKPLAVIPCVILTLIFLICTGTRILPRVCTSKEEVVEECEGESTVEIKKEEERNRRGP